MLNRRTFVLGLATVATSSIILPKVSLASKYIEKNNVKSLTFYNIHTGERLKDIPYFENGKIVKENLKIIYKLMRDKITGEVHPIHSSLIDTIFNTQKALGLKKSTINIISGYRSPKTNEQLAEHSSLVSRRSYHVTGKAIDFNIEGINLAHVHKALLYLKNGGVGYYPKGGFVHIDKGYFRTW